MPRVVVFGSLNHDITVTVPHMPASDETLTALSLVEYCGGKGFNQAVAAVRLGAQTAMVGAVGADGAGVALRAALAANHIDATHVVESAEHTGTAVITTDQQDVTIVIVPGANGTVDATDAEDAAELLASADVVVLQGEVAAVASARAAQLARQGGALVVYSPAPVSPDASLVIAYATHIVANQGEAAALNLKPSERVIITQGVHGALVGNRIIPSFAADVVDPTGAGDAFTAAFAVALAEGADVYEAARQGCAAGSWAVRIGGAEPSMPTRENLRTVLAGG